MKKYVFPGLVFVTMLAIFSCKRVDLTSRYAYNANKDTIAPVLSFTVPVNLDNYAYGEYIHMVGTVTDLESKNSISSKSGRLKSLYITVATIDPVQDTIIKTIFSRWPEVDGKSGVTINETTTVSSGSGTTYCRLTSVATDQANHTDSVKLTFTVN